MQRNGLLAIAWLVTLVGATGGSAREDPWVYTFEPYDASGYLVLGTLAQLRVLRIKCEPGSYVGETFGVFRKSFIEEDLADTDRVTSFYLESTDSFAQVQRFIDEHCNDLDATVAFKGVTYAHVPDRAALFVHLFYRRTSDEQERQLLYSSPFQMCFNWQRDHLALHKSAPEFISYGRVKPGFQPLVLDPKAASWTVLMQGPGKRTVIPELKEPAHIATVIRVFVQSISSDTTFQIRIQKEDVDRSSEPWLVCRMKLTPSLLPIVRLLFLHQALTDPLSGYRPGAVMEGLVGVNLEFRSKESGWLIFYFPPRFAYYPNFDDSLRSYLHSLALMCVLELTCFSSSIKNPARDWTLVTCWEDGEQRRLVAKFNTRQLGGYLTCCQEHVLRWGEHPEKASLDFFRSLDDTATPSAYFVLACHIRNVSPCALLYHLWTDLLQSKCFKWLEFMEGFEVCHVPKFDCMQIIVRLNSTRIPKEDLEQMRLAWYFFLRSLGAQFQAFTVTSAAGSSRDLAPVPVIGILTSGDQAALRLYLTAPIRNLTATEDQQAVRLFSELAFSQQTLHSAVDNVDPLEILFAVTPFTSSSNFCAQHALDL